MARGRFILRYRGEGKAPDADLDRIRELPGAVVVDASGRMLLVEADADALRQLVDNLGPWVMAPERSYSVPDVRKRIE
jgi:hypothetical protein